MIQKYSDINCENTNWEEVCSRLKKFRLLKNISTISIAESIQTSESRYKSIESLNKHKSNRNEKDIEIILKCASHMHISLNWLFNGIGKHDDKDPDCLLPDTFHVEKGAGIRRTLNRQEAEEGTFSGEMMEFVMTIDNYKRLNNIKFLSITQIFEVIAAMGYRKVANPTIAVCKIQQNNALDKED